MLVGPLIAAGVLMVLGGVLGALWIWRRQKRNGGEGETPWGMLVSRKRSKQSIEAPPSQALHPSVRGLCCLLVYVCHGFVVVLELCAAQDRHVLQPSVAVLHLHV